MEAQEKVSKFIYVGDSFLNTDYIIRVSSFGPESYIPTTLKIVICVYGGDNVVIHYNSAIERDATMLQLQRELGKILAP